MFVSRETQERIDKLEADNKALKKELGEAESNRPNTSGLKAAMVIGWVLFLLAAAATYYFYQQSQIVIEEPKDQILTKDGPTDWVPPVDSGIVFRVQVGAFEEFSLEPFRAELDGIYSFRNDNLEKISLGNFSSFRKAQSFLDYMFELGFEDAYITAYQDGKPLGLMMAVKMQASSSEGLQE
ncbi:MAG: hypothetical protein HWD92_08965 [Flavobacteriia bacterium]|nr:hypothetical protein [Flavobacteriia bacterium]